MKLPTRDDVVAKCADTVAACFNHYSDTPLSPRDRKRVASALHKIIPDKLDMLKHARRVKEAEERYAREDAECTGGGAE